jgi:hypothetical protein
MRIARYLLITLGGSSLVAMDDMKEDIASCLSVGVQKEDIPG